MKDRVDFQPETREKLSAPDYAGQMVAWARKKTESIVGRSNKDIYQTLDRNSVAVVGEDEAGRKVFDVQFPHVSVGSAEEVIEARRNAEKIWKKGLRNVARAGLINEGQAKEISLENGPYISFQNQAKGAFKTERRRDDQKEGKSTRTAIPLAQRAVTRAAYSKGARLLAVGGVVMLANSACTVPEVAPAARPTEPAVSETVPIPTASPEAISSFNESAQKIVDEAFKGLGVHDINMVGAGILADPESGEYALFTSILPDKNNATDLEFLLIGEVGTDNQVENIKGLVLGEEQQGSVLEFIAVSFNPETQTFVIENPYLRTNTETGEIEIYKDGLWQTLDGPGKTIGDIQVKLGGRALVASALPIPTPEAIPTPMGANILDLMERTRQDGGETFNVLDPSGVEAVVDVVPPEVVEQGSWSWELRGFTKEVEGQLQVWRTLKGREKDLSRWFDVVSLLDVPGYGNVTIEFDREAMAKKGLTEIYLQSPQDWKAVLDIFWEEKQTASIAEPSDYGLIHEKIIERKVIPFEIYSFEKLTRNAGVSFVIVPEFDESFNQAETWQGQTTKAFKNTAQAGKPVLFLYFRHWIYEGQDLRHNNMGYTGIADLGWFTNQGGQQGVEAMIREDRNPWYATWGVPRRIQKAWFATLDFENSVSKLIGPLP